MQIIYNKTYLKTIPELFQRKVLHYVKVYEKDAKYVIVAPSREWKNIFEGSLDPIMALMRGKLILKKGSLSSLLPYVSAAKELVMSAIELDTDLPEEWK